MTHIKSYSEERDGKYYLYGGPDNELLGGPYHTEQEATSRSKEASRVLGEQPIENYRQFFESRNVDVFGGGSLTLPELPTQASFDYPAVSQFRSEPLDDFVQEWATHYPTRERFYSPGATDLRATMEQDNPEAKEAPADKGSVDQWIPASNLWDRSITGHSDIPGIPDPRTDVPVRDEDKSGMVAQFIKTIYPQAQLDENIVAGIVGDLIRPFTDNPAGPAMAGGVRDLGQGLVELASEVSEAAGLGPIDFELPQIESADEPAAHLVRGMTQFFAGFGAAGGLAKGAGLLRQTLAGGAADATFDPELGNLSTMLREQFNTDNELVNFLDAKVGEDADAVERLNARVKMVLEGAGLGALVPAAMFAMRQMKEGAPEAIQAVKDVIAGRPGNLQKQLGMVAFHGVPDLSMVDLGPSAVVATQSSEALPSTGLLQGRIIKQYPIEKQTEYQRGMDEITDGFVEEIIGIDRVSSVNAPSRYGGHIGESQQIVYKVETTVDVDGFTVPSDATKTQLKQAAAIKGYIQEQDAVVNSFLTPVKDPNLADAAELYVGRVITHDEMVQVDELLGRLGKEHGFDPDDIALPTTAEGVNILNVSFGDIDSETFHVIGDTIAQHFDVGDIGYFKNTLLDDGYVGGFSGYQSGQDAYRKIWSETNLRGSGAGRQGERWWGHADRIEAKKAEVSAYTEGYVKQNPLPRKNIRQIGEESDIRYSERGETLDPKDFSPEARETLATRLHDEVVTVLQGGDKDARGWYTSKYQEALDVTSKHLPGLRKSDKTGRRLFTTFIEIASDQAVVPANYSNAVKVWQSYQKTGKVNSLIPTGKASASYRKNLNLLQRLIDGKGPKGVKGLKGAMDWLDETARVGDIEKELGIKLSGYSKNAVLPRQVAFGPKLGIFGANLKGSPQYLTMDRWWSRTFNRLRGTMAPPPTEKSIQSFKKLIGKPRAQKKTVLKEAEKIAKAWAKRGFKNGTPLERAANTIYKSSIELRDAPINVGDRKFQQSVTEDAVSALRNEGWDDMTVADLQAIVWYHEKRRMREYGSRAPIDELDFSDAAKKYWTKK
jgi:hypothetical protein